MKEQIAKSDWESFMRDETLFSNAIRLRHFIWTISRFAPSKGRLLETGFGSGKTAVIFADMGYHVTAIDIDPILVERVLMEHDYYVRSRQLQVLQADMTSLPWNHRAFDLVYHQGVLEHFPDETIIQALREQARVAPWVIFDVPNHRYGAQPFGDERLLRPSHWRRLIRQAGLEVVNQIGRGFHSWQFLLPYVMFSNKGVAKFPCFSRWFGDTSIFVCMSKEFEK